MVSEDRECVRSESTCRYVEHTRELLAGNLIHIGYHKEETLRCGVCCGQGTGLERTVHCTGSAAFRLHFLYEYSLTEYILASGSRPFVNIFSHG